MKLIRSFEEVTPGTLLEHPHNEYYRSLWDGWIPGSGSRRIGTIPPMGLVVFLGSPHALWAKVLFGDKIGYIFASHDNPILIGKRRGRR